MPYSEGTGSAEKNRTGPIDAPGPAPDVGSERFRSAVWFILVLMVASYAVPARHIAREVFKSESVSFWMWIGSTPHPLLVKASTLQNLGLLIIAALATAVFGTRYRWHPVILATLGLLAISFTLSQPLPGLTDGQMARTGLAFLIAPLVGNIRLPVNGERWLLRTLCVLAPANVLIGHVFDMLNIHSMFRIQWGTLRLAGATNPTGVASLALVGVMFSLLLSTRRPIWLAICGLNFWIIVWTGTRTSVFAAGLFVVGWCAMRLRDARRNKQALPLGSTALLLASMVLALVSYAPQLARRFTTTDRHNRDAVIIHLPWAKSHASSTTDDEDSEADPLLSLFMEKAPVGEEDTTPRPEEMDDVLVVSTTGRLFVWRTYWQVARHHAWFGHGLGASIIAGRATLHRSFQLPHNEFLRVVVDTGFAGLSLLLLGYVLAVRQGLRAWASPSGRIVLMLAIAVLGLQAGLQNPLAGQIFMIGFWLFLYVGPKSYGPETDDLLN